MSRFMRVMNKFPALLLRSPLHGLISGSVLLITFTGRKSGKKYTGLRPNPEGQVGRAQLQKVARERVVVRAHLNRSEGR